MAEDSSFIIFVNNELPTRISTKADPASLSKGLVPVSTGLGLEVEFKKMSGGNSIGLMTDEALMLDDEGKALLTKIPHGGILLNLGMAKLTDGSYLEILGMSIIDNQYVKLPEDDFAELKDVIESITVSYIGDLY